MGYRRMNINDLKDIFRRLQDGKSIRFISEATGFDRKTIRGYRDRMIESELLPVSYSDATQAERDMFEVSGGGRRIH